jgi:benzylsuccinate CoA-transferase BbsF subunit
LSKLPFNGVRVVDLSWIIAGPTATRFLAMMGAEVIKIGSGRRPDPSTRGAPFQAYNQGKLYASLNISKPEGLDLALELISASDVVIENFAAGVIERLGLGYDVLCKARPDIIMVSSAGTGHSGPDKDYVAYGSLLQSYTGWNSISGYPGGEPIKGGLWADPWVGMELAMITSAALNHRAVTGVGQYIDFSMAEALTTGIPEVLLDYQMNGRIKEPTGNDDDWSCPHNVYHCKGQDRWLAIAVTSNEEWRALCGAIDRPDLVYEASLGTVSGRKSKAAMIDEAITAWTLQQDDYEAAELLQQAGVPAGPYLEPPRVFNNPQLREGGYFETKQASDGKMHDLPGLGWRITDVHAYNTAAPVLGMHNEYVYQNLLGLTKDDVEQFVQDDIIY